MYACTAICRIRTIEADETTHNWHKSPKKDPSHVVTTVVLDLLEAVIHECIFKRNRDVRRMRPIGDGLVCSVGKTVGRN